jgi:hypothetical protein
LAWSVGYFFPCLLHGDFGSMPPLKT